jgi:protein-tyrosine phosphatase
MRCRQPCAACDDLMVALGSASSRWIALDGAVNVRAVVPGVLLRADNLQELSQRDVRLLIEQEAVEVVLDLRTATEVKLEGPGPMTAEQAVRIEHHSLYPESAEKTDLEAKTIKPWGEPDPEESLEETPAVRAYLGYLRRRPDSVVRSLRAIARADGAVLVHCAAGKDRTGVVVAIALDAAGVDRGTIVRDYLATAERIDAILARLVRSPTYRAELAGHDPQSHAPLPGVMERVLDVVEDRHGGSGAWLRANGLSGPDLERLQRRLTPA